MLLAATGGLLRAQTASPVTDGFNPNPNGIVNAVVLQPDGKMLIGGYFTQVQPEANPLSGHGYIARINHDGSVDTTFSPNANGVVRTMALQANGQIVVGGEFTTFQGTGNPAQVPASYIARLNADGSLDSSFNLNANGVVYAIAVQPNGQVVIGGSFTTIQVGTGGATTVRNHVARFNADGTLDMTFDPDTDRPVLSLAVQANGQVLIGGGFTVLKANGAAAATTRNCLARVNADGSLDTGFDPEANGSVMSLTVLPNGQILIGGQFTGLEPNGATSVIQCDYFGRLNTDGTLDSTYIINPLAYVSAVAVGADGSVIIAGIFTSIFAVNSTSQTSINYVARIFADGSVDTTFNPSPDQAVNAIAIQPDGNVVLGGYFEHVSGAARNFLARVTPQGGIDGSLAPNTEGGVFASATLSTGQMYVGGTFLTMGGISQSYLARVNADGSLDQSFAPTLNGPVTTITLQSNGQILVGGNFTVIDGILRQYMARLNSDGSVDGPFNPSPNAAVQVIYPLSTGKILIAGAFFTLQPNGTAGPIGVTGFARLNADGSVDETFDPNPNGEIFAIVPQSDGNLILAGEFTSIGEFARGYIARLLTATGTIDPNYNPNCNLAVYTVAVQSDGKAVIGGLFSAMEPQTAIAAQFPTPTTPTNNPYGPQTVFPAPGVSANEPIYINHMARVNADGTLDSTYFPDPSDVVQALSLQSDGSAVIGGNFTSVAPNGAYTGTIRNYLARITPTGALDPAFDPDANGPVDVVQVLPNSNILVAGNFTTLQPNGSTVVMQADHMAILNPNGSVDPAFVASTPVPAQGQVNALVYQPNGQVLVGGSFGPMGGNLSPDLTLFNADGTPGFLNSFVNGPVNTISLIPNGSTTTQFTGAAVWLESTGAIRHIFAASSNGAVNAVVQQPDGKVLVGGTFSSFNNGANTAYLARLNTDGSVDTSFVSPLNGGVNAILLLPNGQIVVGGSFTDLLAGTTLSYLARLNADGSLDSSFQPSPNLDVTCLALQSDGDIIAGGDFTAVESNNTTNIAARNYLARFKSDGTLDTTFNPDPSGTPAVIVVLSSGKILIGGDFNNINPNLGTAVTQGSLVLLNADGTLVTSFDPNPQGPVTTVVVQPDGKILVSGSFNELIPGQANTTTTLTATPTGNFVRLNSDGTIDTTFYPYPNEPVSSIALLANGQMVIGGTFTSLSPVQSTFSVSRLFIARLNADGTVDPSFDPELNGTVTNVDLLQDGSLFVGGDFTAINTGASTFIGGSFTTIGGNPAPFLARLNADSTVDTTFTANPDGPVNAIVPLRSGETLIGGSFAHVGGAAQANLALLTQAGPQDASFTTGTNGTVNSIAVQANGQIVVAGAFTKVGGQTVTYLARLGSSGAPDASFIPVINQPVNALVLMPNGQMLIGGSFTSVDGQPVGGIARLNADGSVDATFNPNSNGTIEALALATDGTLMAGGSFTTIGGASISNLAHVEASGAVDTSFAPNPNGAVDAILIQPDGRVVIGGAFTLVGGLTRYEMARLSTPTQVNQVLTTSPDETVITWTRTGPAPIFTSVLFEESTDGTNFVRAGYGVPINETTWQLAGVPPIGATTFYLRATAILSTTRYSSSGIYQDVVLVNVNAIPTITSAGQAAGGAGTAFSFSVTATKSPSLYTASGLPPGLVINSTTGVISGMPSGTGSYKVAVTASNSAGSSTSNLTITIGNVAETSFVPSSTSAADRLLNLSCRSELSGSDTLVVGFVVAGTGQKPVLVRAVGPGLAAFGVPNLMADPVLQLYSASGTVIAQNAGWGGSTALAAKFAQVGAFALPSGSADAALLTTLAPGTYTIHVFDPSGKGGVAIAEIYDASATPATDTARLSNLSSLGKVSPGAGALIGGFVVTGTGTKSVIIRGVGPGLANFAISDGIADPVLSVYDHNGNMVAQNSAWSNQVVFGPYQDSVGTTNVVNTDALVGAFALSAGDTALIADLPPGAYTYQITSASNAQGEALGEVYELP